MNETCRYLLFTIGEARFGVPLNSTERVIRAAEVTPVPEAPAIVLGVIDLHGEVVPVLDTRVRLRLPARPIEVFDHFLLVFAAGRHLALLIDRPLGVLEVPPGAERSAPALVPGLEHVSGVVRLEDGLVLIHDVERFLSYAEAAALESAMAREVAHGA